ncbi:MAG: dUTP diphosphatase [Chitinophagaceae bacterium]|nr:MAG: dUTP diphosphatase [Chitinophagaceae bacterium]
MLPVEIKIINTSNNLLPAYATSGSAGMDLCSFLEKPITLKPMERVLVPTGLFMELPSGFEGQVRPRSGLALKQGITCLNSPGTIDADYRGEIKIILINLSEEEQQIKTGERIAQLVINKVEQIQWKTAELLNETLRSEGGFGHTGK